MAGVTTMTTTTATTSHVKHVALLRHRLIKGTAWTVGGSTVVGATGLAVYTSTEPGQGLKREMRFWYGVAPVVWDYYWNFASSSPYVKYYLKYKQESTNINNDEQLQTEFRAKRRDKLQQLHEKHAPDILQVLLELKGLYVKLGQVLSVTSLPVPEAYRHQFRTLQSNVPGWETFDDKVKPVLERELGKPLEELFDWIDPVPCGAASIGQAHKAVLKKDSNSDDNNNTKETTVIVKIQYPDAAWQVPADIQCVGDFLKICVFFGVVDETAARMSFQEFSRQFISELDYHQERQNLQDIYQSTLDDSAPYRKRGVVVPFVYPELCTSKVIVMSYLPGPKLEEEARRQLEALGIDTKKGLRSFIRASPSDNDDKAIPNTASISKTYDEANAKDGPITSTATSFKDQITRIGGKLVGIDSFLNTIRLARQLQLIGTAITAKTLDLVTAIPLIGSFLVPAGIQNWAQEHRTAFEQAKRLSLTKEWIDALFDVHAHQIFHLGCFNADAHPGNILILEEEENDNKDTTSTSTGKQQKSSFWRKHESPKLGLIDFGQCKRLTPQEQAQVARLIVAVANKESDEKIASAFRELGIQTKNDSTVFLAQFSKLMFGPLQSYHLDHSWHQALHKQDAVTYFPSQLSMVYRTSMLLRGLALSLQMNVSIGDLWKHHAQGAIDRYDASLLALDQQTATTTARSSTKTIAVEIAHKQTKPKVLRRMSTKDVIEELQEHTVKANSG